MTVTITESVCRFAVGHGRLMRGSLVYQYCHDLIQKLHAVAKNRYLPEQIRTMARRSILELAPIRGGTASNAFETSLLALIFNATPIADIADNDATTPATTLSVSLHSADPGEAGTMTTSEVAYSGYVRRTINRNSGGWVVTGDHVNPQANIDFAISGAAGATVGWFGIGTGVANNLMLSGTVAPQIPIGAAGITPILTTATAITLD